MILYTGKTFSATRVASALVEVDCEKCGKRYWYELTRSGSGSGHAPYHIGKKSAARQAELSAEKDVAARLERDSEMVPCPSCGWVNEQLIKSHRRRSHQWATAAIVGCVLAGIVVPFVLAGNLPSHMLTPAVVIVLWSSVALLIIGGPAETVTRPRGFFIAVEREVSAPTCWACAPRERRRWWLTTLLCGGAAAAISVVLIAAIPGIDSAVQMTLSLVALPIVFGCGVIYGNHRWRLIRTGVVDAGRSLHWLEASNPAYTRLVIEATEEEASVPRQSPRELVAQRS